MVSGTETARVEPLPPIATGFEPPEEPITRVGMLASLLGSSDRPPPAPPREMATPASGVTCRPVPGGTGRALKSTALPLAGASILNDCTTDAKTMPWASFNSTSRTDRGVSAALPTPAFMNADKVIFSVMLSTTLPRSLTRRSPSITRVLASTTSRVSPRSIGALPSALMTMVSPTRRRVPRV